MSGTPLRYRLRSSNPKDSPWSGENFGLNLRFMLIVSVFVGNAVEPLIQTMPEVKALFLWMLTFQMPLFVGVTGYFAKNNLFGHSGDRILKQIALQYLLFQSIYSLLDIIWFQVPGIKHSFFVPYLLLWFLVGHVIWRLLMRVFARLNVRHPFIWACAIGILAGFLPIQGTWFGFMKTLVYFPFFVIGYSFSLEWIQARMHGVIRTAGLAVSLVLFVVMFVFAPHLEPAWLSNSMNFYELGWMHSSWQAIVMRCAIYGIEFIGSIAFLAWVPQRLCAFTDWGKRTLYVFLIHGIIIRIIAATGMYDHITNGWFAILLIACAVTSTILLLHPKVRQWTRPVIEPNSEAVFGWIRRGAWRSHMKHS